ncbi:LysE family translocator [Planktotalea arctica]|uniref:LysE family translocator n=1 Tax=Planktotalea arctica TaxID=1481893 RepID=UPI000A16DD8D|nr:LysE family translocator [Planktotalea arctica]
MDVSLWLAFVAASTALLLIPGPTILLVLSYALSQGRKVALATASGVALGDLIAMSASLIGLGALIATSALAFTIVKWAGALYLLFLGVKMLRSAPKNGAGLVATDAQATPRQVFWHSAFVTALNPKSIGFFIAFVPQFISLEAAYAPQASILIATFVALAALNALAYALLADLMRRQISQPKVIRRLTQAGGITLIGMGAATAMLRRA